MLRAASLTVFCALLLPACGDDSAPADDESTGGEETTETGAEGVGFATDVQPIVMANCICHIQGPDGSMTADYLTLNADVAFAELVNAPAMGAAGQTRVVPGDLDASYLWRKLNGTHGEVGGAGNPMPPLGTLDGATLGTIEEWIVEGAQP